MSTETKVASEAAANPASTSTKEAVAQAVKEAPAAKKPIQSGKPSGSPKPPKSPKRVFLFNPFTHFRVALKRD